MPSLSVTDFSCLRSAFLELAPINVIIGPQGSGKSLTTKLFYFFTDSLSAHIVAAERGDTIEEFKKTLSRQFNVWFPPSAWGGRRFNITYYAGKFSVRILRRKSQGKMSDEVAITFSDWFESFYDRSLAVMERARAGEDQDLEPSIASLSFDKMWRARDLINRRLSAELGSEFVNGQTFIPAGRAFFTSIGRLVAGLEQAGMLDPVTVKFARLFATLRDRSFRAHSAGRVSLEHEARRAAFMGRLFGGEIKFEGESEFVETKDGRKIPFSSLSSGQQELLPMWSLIDYLGQMDNFRKRVDAKSGVPREIVYIEEPEAHLFPSAQSLLMEFLISSIVGEKSPRSLVITTHSPYIMSKLNVFLKAGQLSRRKKRNQAINDVVPRECWLSGSELSASAIINEELVDIVDDDGLIDATYLDGISEDIAQEYSDLLQIESEI